MKRKFEDNEKTNNISNKKVKLLETLEDFISYIENYNIGPNKKKLNKILPSLIKLHKLTGMTSVKKTIVGHILYFLMNYEKNKDMIHTVIEGPPGVGKTTVLLDLLASIQIRGRKCLFISGEMGKKQMFKYTERFPQFGLVKTLFMSDYLNYNTKDVIEQALDMGFDLVLIDSAAEVIEGVRDDNGWDRKMAESWLVDICNKNNKGENKENKYTSFFIVSVLSSHTSSFAYSETNSTSSTCLCVRQTEQSACVSTISNLHSMQCQTNTFTDTMSHTDTH
jgi:hypothetical protein